MLLNKKNKNRYLFLLIFCVLAGFVFYFLYRTGYQEVIRNLKLDQTLTPSATTGTKPDVTIKNFTFKEYEKNRAYALIVTAVDGNFFNASNTITCKTITCTILNNNTEIAHVNAGQATINRASKEIFFKGPVHGNFKDIFLESSDIRYNFSTQVLSSDHQIRYRHAHAFFSSEKSVMNIKDNSITMQGGVYSEFFSEPRDTQPTQ